MIFVCIDKTYSSIPVASRPYHLQHLPDHYPLDCLQIEADSLEGAQALCPEKRVMSLEAYQAYLTALMESFPIDENAEPPGFFAKLFGG